LRGWLALRRRWPDARLNLKRWQWNMPAQAR
jgi:hypothetical protein